MTHVTENVPGLNNFRIISVSKNWYSSNLIFMKFSVNICKMNQSIGESSLHETNQSQQSVSILYILSNNSVK